MGKETNEIGNKYGRLTIIKQTEDKRYYECLCECGNHKVARLWNLKSGDTKSCGCYLKEIRKTLNRKHGMKGTKIYRTWQSMKRRCYNINDNNYKHYGKRKIVVCDEWKNDFMSFYNWAMTNGYDDSLTLDRIDVDGNYEPNNCRWVDQKTQQNNKRNNCYIEYKGMKKTLSEWADYYNLSYRCVKGRHLLGWDIKRIVETPIKKRKKEEQHEIL